MNIKIQPNTRQCHFKMLMTFNQLSQSNWSLTLYYNNPIITNEFIIIFTWEIIESTKNGKFLATNLRIIIYSVEWCCEMVIFFHFVSNKIEIKRNIIKLQRKSWIIESELQCWCIICNNKEEKLWCGWAITK